MPNRNVDGISKVACTSRHAPVSVKLRTAHGSCAFLPRIIVPDLSIRLRGTVRWLAIGFRLDIDRSHSYAAAVDDRNLGGSPDEGVNRSPPETALVGWGAAAVPIYRIPLNRKSGLNGCQPGPGFMRRGIAPTRTLAPR